MAVIRRQSLGRLRVWLRRFAAGDNTTFTLFHSGNSPLPGSYITDVEADPAGGIWVATDYGLARFDGSTWTTYTQANSGLPGLLVTDVARRASDGLIAASIQHGNLGSVSTFDGSTWTHYTTANSPLTHPQVQAVEFDGNGNLWASAYGEGVVQIMIGAPPLQLASAASRKLHAVPAHSISLCRSPARRASSAEAAAARTPWSSPRWQRR
jgi:ligand-binding sensor domain-containing protein